MFPVEIGMQYVKTPNVKYNQKENAKRLALTGVLTLKLQVTDVHGLIDIAYDIGQ